MDDDPDSDFDVFEGGVGKRTGVGTGELDLDFESLRCLCGTEDKGCFLESDVDRLDGEGEGMGLGEVRMARFLTLARCEGIGGPFAILVRGSASRPRILIIASKKLMSCMLDRAGQKKKKEEDAANFTIRVIEHHLAVGSLDGALA